MKFESYFYVHERSYIWERSWLEQKKNIVQSLTRCLFNSKCSVSNEMMSPTFAIQQNSSHNTHSGPKTLIKFFSFVKTMKQCKLRLNLFDTIETRTIVTHIASDWVFGKINRKTTSNFIKSVLCRQTETAKSVDGERRSL